MKKNSHSFWRLLYKIHRYIGLFSALVLLMLAVTGIALNHTEDFKFDSQFIGNDSLLNWYGIYAPDTKHAFKTNHHYLSQFDKQIYLDEQFILNSSEDLQGAVETDDFIAVALSESVLLLSLEGEVIEQNDKQGLEQIGINATQQVFIKQADKVLFSDDGLLSWQAASDEKIEWSKQSVLAENIKTKIKHKFRGAILPLERVLLDIHSGRFFGNIGVIIVDLCGVLLILLVFSGCAIWLKHKLRTWLHPKKQRK